MPAKSLPVVEHKVLKLTALKPHPDNPRTISDRSKEGLRYSLETFGLVQEIVFNKRSGYVVGGNKRVEILRENGETEAPCSVVDLDPQAEKALLVTLNNPAIQGDFTASELQSLIAQIDQEQKEALLLTDLEAGQDTDQPNVEEKPLARNIKMVWMFAGIEADQYPEVSELIEKLKATPGVLVEQVAR